MLPCMCATPAADAFRSSFPFEPERIRAAAVYCSDGRYGEQFDDFLHHSLRLPRYDRVAIPGGAACLAGHFASYREEAAGLEQIRFLVESHELERMVLIAHESCGFYTKLLRLPEIGLRQRQEADLVAAAQRLRSQHPRLYVSAYVAVRDAGLVRFDPVGVA
jgi:hypothetical protein